MEDFEEKCPQVAQALYRAMVEVMDTAGYPAGVQGLWSGSTRSTSGCFVIGRQHPETKVFRVVWYNHGTGEVKMKDVKKGKQTFESLYHKVASEVGL